MKSFNGAIVGVAGFGRELAAAATHCKYFNLAGACDTQMENLAQFKRSYDVNVYASYDDILRDRTIHGVVLATPNDTHLDLIAKAARAGKHVFVEKPITNTIPDAYAAIEAAEKAGVTLFVGHVARRNPFARMAKKMLDSRELGQVVLVEGHIAHNGGLRLTPQAWRWYRERCPGGPLMQLAIHTVDTFHYLIGPIKSVSARVSRLSTPAEIEDTAVLAFDFENGILGTIGTAYTVPSSTSTFIYGNEAAIFMDRSANEFTVRYKDGRTESKSTVSATKPLVEELDEFARCSLTGARPETGGPEGLHALAVIQAALDSSRLGRTILVADVLKR